MDHFFDRDREDDAAWNNSDWRPCTPIWKIFLIAVGLLTIGGFLLETFTSPSNATELPGWNEVESAVCVNPAVTRIVALATFDKETLRGRLLIKRTSQNAIVIKREYFKAGKHFKIVTLWRHQGRCLDKWRVEPIEVI